MKFIITTCLLFILAGCEPKTIKIADLITNNIEYKDKEVHVAGIVKNSVSILGKGGYMLDDGSAEVIVLSTNTKSPSEGSRISISGTYKVVANILDANICFIELKK